MEQIFKILLDSQKASQIALDSVGRVPYPTLAVCVENNDLENRRRIKVALPSNPGLQSDWVRRLDITPYCDNPVPTIGQTVFIFYADGLETNLYYLPLINDTNPPRDKKNPLEDCSREIPGNNDLTIRGNDSRAVDGKITANAGDIEVNSEAELNVDVKQNILMKALQAITIQATQYVMLKAGNWFFKLFSNGTSQMGGGVLTIDCGGYGIHFTNCSTMTINGKEILVVGSVDTRGDANNDRGY